jgi:zinc protease
MSTSPNEPSLLNHQHRMQRQALLKHRGHGNQRLGGDVAWHLTFIWFLVVFLSGVSCGWATGRSQANAADILRTTLDNGLRLVIVRHPIAPVVTTVVNYLVGSNEAPEGFPGMAHAQEHMMFRGSPGLSASQLAAITASMGGLFDADTQQVVTQYFFTVPAEDLEVALRIEAIRMRGVLDSERLWSQERGAIEQEVAQDLSSPDYMFYTELLAAMFKGTPYAHDALGTRASFDQTTGAMLKAFYDTWYVPNNAILVIVGDVQPQKVLGEVKRLFGDIPRKPIPPRAPIRLQPITPQTFELNSDLPYGLAIIAFRMPGYDSPDYAAVEVLADVLNSPRSELGSLAAAGKVLQSGFSLSPLPKAGLGYAMAAFPKGGDAQAVIREVQEVLSRSVQNGISADLVAAAKRQARAESEFQKHAVSGLAMAWSQALAVEDRQSPEDEVRAIEQITVTDVHRAARHYLDPDHAIIAILTPKASGKPVAGKGFGGQERVAMQPSAEVTLPVWAHQALDRLSIPASSVQPVVSVLPNGLKLIVQPTSISDSVMVYGHINNQPALQVPNGKEGVDAVLEPLFAFGTTSHDRLALQKALDDIGAQASAGTTFQLQVLADQFEPSVQLLAENELHPALPESAFAIVRSQQAATVAGQLQSPEYLTQRTLQTALYPQHDPMLREATPATIASLTLQDVRDYYRSVFRPDQTTIVVIGKIDPERAKSVIERHFGPWEAVGPKPDILLPPVPLNPPATIAVPNASRVQTQVILAQTPGLTHTTPDYYALELGNHVLGGGFYATRLYRQLREQTGLVYHVSATLEANQTRSLYSIDYACDPDKVAEARVIAVRNVRDMQTQLVRADELRQAKAMLLRRLPLAESSLDSIANGLLARSALGLPLDEPSRAAAHYMALSAEQVRAAFQRWLHLDHLVEVSEGPVTP